jgi:hypothetical protein
MPIICKFLGIIITMYWEKDAQHHRAHFHAKYGNDRCVFAIPELTVLADKLKLPAKQMNLVKPWANQHIEELILNWRLVEQKDQPIRIGGLK